MAAAKSSATAWARACRARRPDLVITNVVVLDYWGIVKADVGIKDGRISAIGKAGNGDVMDGVDPLLEIGAGTEIIAGEGLILTAGGIDSHIHFIAPQQIDEAISSGITTMIGGGTGPATGTKATTCTPGRVEHRAHAAGGGRVPGEPWVSGQRQLVGRGVARGAGRSRARAA